MLAEHTTTKKNDSNHQMFFTEEHGWLGIGTTVYIYRLHAIPDITKCKTDSGRKSRHYAAILSGKDEHSLWSLSTAKHFARSVRQRGMQVSLFASVSVKSCLDFVHSGCKCKITSCTGEIGA